MILVSFCFTASYTSSTVGCVKLSYKEIKYFDSLVCEFYLNMFHRDQEGLSVDI